MVCIFGGDTLVSVGLAHNYRDDINEQHWRNRNKNNRVNSDAAC